MALSFTLSHHDDDAIGLLEIFYEIDSNDNGSLSLAEMRKYLMKRGATEEDVQTLMRNLDTNRDGEISLSEFCEAIEIGDKFFEKPTKHDKDIEEINLKGVSFHKQYVLVNSIRRAQRLHGNDYKEVAKYIKTQLDSLCEKLWHVLLVKGQYWAFYSHEPENSVVLKYKGLVYIIFKTPA